MAEATFAVIYAAKSTEDKHGSIATQIADCRALAKRQGWTVVDAYSDEAFSAYSGNRGPGLDQAKEVAISTAEEHGGCILVAQDGDRFARGAGDEPDAADHLVEVFFALKRQRVSMWTERTGELDPMRAALEGVRSHDESARKTQAVKAGKRRQAERGEHLGGPLPDGYRREFYIDERGEQRRRVVIDDARVEVVRRVFKLGADGVPDAQIARSLNAERVKTRAGNAWTRRAVQDLLTRPFYAGRIVYEDETFRGNHKPLIDPGAWDRLMAARGERDLGHGQHVIGRPAGLHALQGLAVCGVCGRRMHSYTAGYRRKDGSRQRLYRCPGYAESNGSCTATTFDAPTLDAAVLDALDELIPDFEKWLDQITERHSEERSRLEHLRDRCFADCHEQAQKLRAVEEKWSAYVADGDSQKAETVLPIVERERKELGELETRAQAAHDAVESVPAETPTDAVLDFAAALRRALDGVNTGGPMEQVNAELRRTFSAFTIWRTDDGEIQIEPNLHMSVARELLVRRMEDEGIEDLKDLKRDSDWTPWLVAEDAEPPPMKWVGTAFVNSDHSQL